MKKRISFYALLAVVLVLVVPGQVLGIALTLYLCFRAYPGVYADAVRLLNRRGSGVRGVLSRVPRGRRVRDTSDGTL